MALPCYTFDAVIVGAGGAGIGGVADLRHGAVVVGIRGKAVVAVGGDRQRADAGDSGDLAGGEAAGHTLYGEGRHTQGVVDIVVVAQHIAGGNGVFGNG